MHQITVQREDGRVFVFEHATDRLVPIAYALHALFGPDPGDGMPDAQTAYVRLWEQLRDRAKRTDPAWFARGVISFSSDGSLPAEGESTKIEGRDPAPARKIDSLITPTGRIIRRSIRPCKQCRTAIIIYQYCAYRVTATGNPATPFSTDVSWGSKEFHSCFNISYHGKRP